jgi:hypothetical protein
MSEQQSGKQLPRDDRVAVELLIAVRTGDVAAIQGLLRSDPALVSARLVSKDGGRCIMRPAPTTSTLPKP